MDDALLLGLGALLPLVAAFLIGRGAGASPFRGERLAGMAAGALVPAAFWAALLATRWLSPERDDVEVHHVLMRGGAAVMLLTPLCLVAAWAGNRRGKRRRGLTGRSERQR